jgi:hypothetical protein
MWEGIVTVLQCSLFRVCVDPGAREIFEGGGDGPEFAMVLGRLEFVT